MLWRYHTDTVLYWRRIYNDIFVSGGIGTYSTVKSTGVFIRELIKAFILILELKDYSMNTAVNPSFKSNNNPVNPIVLFYSIYIDLFYNNEYCKIGKADILIVFFSSS